LPAASLETLETPRHSHIRHVLVAYVYVIIFR
jgi:hypothetical protein